MPKPYPLSDRPVGPVLAIVLGAAALNWAVWWNGYPILSSDTAAYLANAFDGGMEVRRPSFYPLFVSLTGGRVSLWLVAWAQSLLVSAAWYAMAARLDGPRPFACFGLAMAVAATVTTLPWFAGRIMPDIFVSVLGIVAYLVVFAERRAVGVERLLWLSVAAVCLTCHIGNIPVLVGGLVLALTARPVLGLPLRPVLAPAAVLVGLAGLCGGGVVVANGVLNGQYSLSAEAHVFTMVRLVRYGIIQRLLDEHCATTAYALCPYRADLSSDPNHYAFSPQSPLYKIGGPLGSRQASEEMIAAANRLYPLQQAVAAAGAVVSQFSQVELGMGLGSHGHGATGPGPVVQRHLPAEHPEFISSRQARGQLPVSALNRIIVPVTWCCLAMAFAVAVTAVRRRGTWAAGNAVAFVLLWITANAVAFSYLTTPFDRYQARVAWMAPVVIVLVTASWARRRRLRS